MQKYFNIFFEFNHNNFYNTIEETIHLSGKGYVCVVDANVLTIAQRNLSYRKIINNSLINSCDGSSIALIAGWIYHEKYRALNGPEIFEYYIEKNFKHILLGSSTRTTDQIKKVLKQKNLDVANIQTIPLPFMSIEDFDYKSIAKEINKLKPEIVWVSLGAPKQELFMSNILPLLDKGVMFGIGAAFNFYVGELNAPRFKIGNLSFIWLNRLINEPKKLIRRLIPYLLIMPRLYMEEKRKKRTMY